jgi:hypothetical protein
VTGALLIVFGMIELILRIAALLAVLILFTLLVFPVIFLALSCDLQDMADVLSPILWEKL